ncbi:MAG TPA: LysR family transcriptional regulator [Polyangiaceae bacterium]|jgi:DNA-binding transcriptional LysR family regulator|nr:LysR family transcriptional regulator [Polyangiaceae bacterium]
MTMLFDTGRLAAFAAVVRAGGFSKAANELGKTQSSVSQSVLLLERELGQKLFSRDGHTPRLTDAGRALLRRTTRIFDEMALAETELAALSELRFGELVVGTSDTLACYFLPPVFAAFRERYPQVELRLDNRPSPVIAERVSERQVDLGIVSLPLPETLELSGRKLSERLDCVVLAAQEDVAVCAPSHALAQRRQITVRDLAPHPLLLLDRTTSSRALVEAAFAREKAPLRVALEMSSVEVLKRLAELGFGVAIVPRISVQRELDSLTLCVLTLKDFGPRRSVGALTPRAFPPTRAARAFLALAQDYSRPRRSSSSSSSPK